MQAGVKYLVRRTVVATAFFAVILGPANAADAQTPVAITSDVACESCRLELTRVAVLGTAEGPGALAGEPSSVSRNSKGDLFVSQYVNGTEILVFDASGAHLETVGRAGDGPGEYRYIAKLVVGPIDSVYVFDNGGARLTVLAPDRSYARASQLQTAFTREAVVVRNESLLVNQRCPRPMG
jgi:6-bladed beta-propeller